MFTGIVATAIPVRQTAVVGAGRRLELATRTPSTSAQPVDRLAFDFDALEIGESIAVNGVCLTVVDFGDDFVAFDVVAETLARSNLGQLSVGEIVNIERALRVGDRFGGHYVVGHVDAIGRISRFDRKPSETLLEVAVDPKWQSRFCTIEKGSVTVDGISLTVVDSRQDAFTVALIPHTLERTNLRGRDVGDWVNLEMDHFGKWVERLLAERGGSSSSRGGATSRATDIC